MSDETTTSAPQDPPPASSSGRHGRFLPGTLLTERYRIVGLLGRGGMGEVYRADDLKLDQPVALKFLPAAWAADPAWLARFHNEVRVARQVSHPSVCRIYDIGEVGGEHFLSMEYVDGEDLASLLRRIGRLPSDKGVELARQLCAGMSAAHEIGVLHRDLKPANVMIDGRGRVKIADFGLAEFADRLATHEMAGTPAYMAPELGRGDTASVRSDIYALGLVLYEIFTGKPAKIATPYAPPSSPSTHVPDLDPAIDRVIMRCLDPDPRKRPGSAIAVAAGLPGADPLAAALAAGETPSPEMVAAAGEVGGLSPLVAWGLVLALVAGEAVFLWAASRVLIYHVVPFDKSPAVLADRARTLLAGFGSQPARDRASGFEVDDDYIRYLGAHRLRQSVALARGRPPALAFWYRHSPLPLVPWSLAARPSRFDPPHETPGMSTVRLDTTGRLVELTMVPPHVDASTGPAPPANWRALFEAADLDLNDFVPIASQWTPPVFADARAAWDGPLPGLEGERLRVEAASYRGQPVSFKLVAPWTRPPLARGEDDPTTTFGGFELLIGAVVVTLFAAACLLARHNLRQGRGDRVGATRVAVAAFTLRMIAFVFGAHHMSAFVAEVSIVASALVDATFTAATWWVLYIALEPFVRRRWPALIISWTRLLAGQIRDPLIGRDILIGAALAFLLSVTTFAIEFIGRSLGTEGYPGAPIDEPFRGVAASIAYLATLILRAITVSFGFMFMLALLTMVLRRRAAAAAALLVLVLTAFVLGAPLLLDRIEAIVPAIVAVVVALRFGVLALAATFLFVSVQTQFPATYDPSTWYAGATMFAIAVMAAIAAFALYTSLGGRPFAGLKLVDDL